MAANTIKTRIFIISDTHSSTSRPHFLTDPDLECSFRPPFPKADVLLHTGDLTGTGTIKENKLALELLASIPAELKLVIAGNHDLTLDKEYYEDETSMARLIDGDNYHNGNVEVVEELWNGKAAKDAGVTYLTEGLYEFTLSNGAHLTVYASPWQPEFCGWAFNYAKNEDRWNPVISQLPFPKVSSRSVVEATRDPHPIPSGKAIDVIMTHGPPWMHGDRCQGDGIRAGCPQLLQALDRVRPRIHCFGHIHEGWGAERVTWRPEPHSPTHPEWAGKKSRSGQLGEESETLGQRVESEGVQAPDSHNVIVRRAAYVDVSSASSRPLQYGKESLLINSSIKDLHYHSSQAGWLVDLELPVEENSGASR